MTGASPRGRSQGERRWFSARLGGGEPLHRGANPARVLAATFAALIAAGTVLLALPAASATGQSAGLLTALFTATSAVCVTGLVVVDTGTAFSPFGQGVILILIQAGGLGTVILYTLVMLLLGRRISLRDRLLVKEALGRPTPAGVVRLVREVVLVTLVLEGIGALVLFLRWAGDHSTAQAAWLAVFHAVSAFNNAGFDLFGTSLRGFATDPWVTATVMALVLLGGIGFTVLDELIQPLRERWQRTLGDSVAPLRLTLHSRLAVKTSLFLLLLAWGGYLLLEWANPATLGALGPAQRPLAALFTAVTPRTAGFEVVPTGGMGQATLLLTMALMFIGASPGGTGGGIKTTTFAALVLAWRAAAQGRADAVVAGRRLPGDLLQRAWVIGTLSVLWVLLVTGVLLVTEGRTLGPVLFEVMSAFGTVGLSTGLTPLLSPVGQVAIILVMFSGRIGPLTLALALAEREFRGDILYPEERVMIG